MRRLLVCIALSFLSAAEILAAEPIRPSADPVPGQYIVVLRDETVRRPGDSFAVQPTVREMAQSMAMAYSGELLFVYDAALTGFAVRMSAEQARSLARDARVSYVQEDTRLSVGVTQTAPTWGIDRIDQRDRPLDSKFTYNTGAGNVRAYIIDTGIFAGHHDFDVRVGGGFTAIADGNGTHDCQGHGTHVAGTVGGATYGVAKGVGLHPVRVFNCAGGGSSATVIAGVNWVTSNHIKPAVANMSLWGPIDGALDTAVRNSIAAGVTYVVIAGNNSGANACNFSPSRVAEAITVGATTSSDARASFSNIGTCVDLFAPGQDVLSAGITSPIATRLESGTSMAAPHVAGVAAIYLAQNPGATPAQVASAIVAKATTNRLSGIGAGSPNRLLSSALGLSYPCSPCSEASCSRPEGAYISHYLGLDCTGQEGYYTLYFGTDGIKRSWDGQGCVGTAKHPASNQSWRNWAGVCDGDAWPGGNPLNDFLTVYRPAACSCPESVCTPPTGAYISHYTGASCTGLEYYYTPYDRNDGTRRPWDGGGCVGTVLQTVTARSFRDSSGHCTTPPEWGAGNTLNGFVRIYR